MAHHHFTRDDRVILAKLISDGLGARSCARILGFHVSSIYREIIRGRSVPLRSTVFVRLGNGRHSYGQPPTNSSESLGWKRQHVSLLLYASTTVLSKLAMPSACLTAPCIDGYGARAKRLSVACGSTFATPS